MSTPTPPAPPTLLHHLTLDHLQRVATLGARLWPQGDWLGFERAAGEGWETFSLMQRVHRLAQALPQALPPAVPQAFDCLEAMAEQVTGAFVVIALTQAVPVCVGPTTDSEHWDRALLALERLTPLATAEFAVRPFLRADLPRMLPTLERWALHPSAAVRRLASEGSRPRLPWAERLPALDRMPSPVWPVLERLRTDGDAVVRRSVANHLNDLAKHHTEAVLDALEAWPPPADEARRAAAAATLRHALRSLVKQGHPRALALLGVGAQARVHGQLRLGHAHIRRGEWQTMECHVRLLEHQRQKVVVDYRWCYPLAHGGEGNKVLKWRTLELDPGAETPLSTRRRLVDLSTRPCRPGRHAVELLVNGHCLDRQEFELLD